MPICPDCYRDGRLEPMIATGTEIFKGREYTVVECVSCGSSMRFLTEQKLGELSAVEIDKKEI